MKPPSPCTGSAMTQAILSAWNWFSNPSRSNSAHSTPQAGYSRFKGQR